MILVLGRKKLEFIDTIPYLFCRLKEPGVKDRCVAQFARPGDHNNVSNYMFSGTFGRMIQDMSSDGTGMAPPLADEVDSIGI
jgi:hypothetical protein